MNEHLQHCPICNHIVDENQLFPKYVCSVCKKHATDEKGDPVVFYHSRFTRIGYQGYYRRNNGLIPFPENTCFVHGVKCVAIDDRLGGVILQPEYDPFEERKTNVMPGSTRYRNVRV